ncbi:MAG: HNH endonuclease family protein [Gammaproteobacteria bacterium WSBS_2016_MAG_OTU1]
MYKEYKHIDELRKELRKFYYIHWIAGKNLSHVKSPSFKIIRKIKEHASIKDMFEYAYKGSDYDEKYLIKEVGKKLQANDIASKVWCKQLLLLIEYATKEEGVPQSFIKLDKNIHLEHIMPRENREGWTHISDKTHKKYLNSAGNLTLLTGKKNIAASNKPFHEKMRIYEGDEDTKITSFNISRDILDAYRKRQEWDKDAMEARKEWFIKEVSKALDIEN